MRHFWQKQARDQHGSVLMLTGLSILILFALAGAGVDFGRQQLVRMKLQNASDAAAVAAASFPNNTVAEREAIAQRYFNLNYPETFLGVARPTPRIEIGATITVEADTDMAAKFVSNVGVERLEAEGRTVVNGSNDQSQAQDVILVMDNSVSMSYVATAPSFTSSTDMLSQRTLAIDTCRQTIFPYYDLACDTSSTQNIWGRSVNYGNSANCKNRAPFDDCSGYGNGISTPGGIPSYGFTGNTRLNALRSVANTFVDTLFSQADLDNRIGIITWSTGVIRERRLTDNQTLIRADINQMGGIDSTNPYAAMQKAAELAHDFDHDHIKAIVLLTDGIPTYSDPDGTPRYVNTAQGPRPRDAQGCDGNAFCQPAVNLTNPVCTQLKNDGITIYTIAFGSDVNTGPNAVRAQDFLRNCASIDGQGNPRFFNAPDGQTLEEAFKQITKQLGKLRIAE